ncbi:MAG: lysophospholipid acyltransferase family protein [Kiritimatiellia bacterium]
MAKSALAANAEYLALRLACALVNAVPYPLAMSLARGLGWTAFRVFRFKRRRTLERIRSVFPALGARAAEQVAVRSLQNVLQTAVEMMRAPRLTREWMDRHVKDGALYKDKLQRFVDEGRGVVIMVPHSGNWYMAAWSMAKYGLPLFAIGARQRNPKLDAWMRRQYGDIEVLDRNCRNTLFKIHERLAQGRAFAILPDLRVRHADVEVDFLGGKANVSHAGAAFAVSCGCPIVLATMLRRDGRHVFNYITTLRPDPQAPDKKAEARRLTRQALGLLSDAIMQSPGDWYWFNKRWILEPV